MRRLMLTAVLILIPAMVQAKSLEKAFESLDPEQRSREVCALKGLEVLGRDPRIRKADRIQPSIFRPSILTGTKLVADGGAVRAGKKWYAISFKCELTPDLLKAVSFTFALGNEIPKTEWEKNGLWG